MIWAVIQAMMDRIEEKTRIWTPEVDRTGKEVVDGDGASLVYIIS